jgi:ATP-dependent DNA helicase DinG
VTAAAEAEARAALHDVVGSIGGQPRSGQERMAASVADAIARHRHLVMQAGTGTGKSFAYLVPAALHSGTTSERVLISTATLALQRQLISTDIPTVLDAIGHRLPRPLAVAVVKGRANYLCRLRLEEAGETDPDEALFALPSRLEQQGAALRKWAERTATGDRDDLPQPVDARVWRAFSVSGRECVGRTKCPVGEQCFAEAARDAAAAADIVVANHTLLAIALGSESDVLPEYDVAIIDEAHELVSRMTQASTESLTAAGLAEAGRRAAGLLSDGAVSRWQEAAEAFAGALQVTLDRAPGQDARIRQAPEVLVRSLARVRDAAHEGLTELADGGGGEAVSRQQAAVAALTEAHDRAGLLLREDAELVRWGSADPLGMAAAPLRIGQLLQDGLLDQSTVVATSATLRLGGSFDELARAWGLRGPGVDLDAPAEAPPASSPSAWACSDAGSPFDYRRQAMLYVPDDLPAPGRAPVAEVVLSRMAALIRAAGGRTLVLATSWRAVDAIAEHLRDAAIPGAPLLVQERGSPVAPMVAAFAAEESSVLVGTLSLWQGVDVPGPSCTCVIMDKIPFPRPDDPLLAARSEAAAAAGASGFAAVSLPHAGLLLAQGAGRLIRTTSDRGVVAILDPRLVQRGYGPYLLDSLPNMWRTADTSVVLAGLQRLRTASDAS